MDPLTLAEQKAGMRAKLKQIRASIPAETRMAHSEAIAANLLSLGEVQAASTLFMFISYGTEVHTHELLKYFLSTGKTLAAPKILPSKTMIAVPFSRWEDLIPGQLGILTPSGDSPYPDDLDVAVTPALGFTPQGHRIGYGRGYYDKWFAACKVRHKIAITFEAQLVDTLPVDETDVPVDTIVTEKRIISID